MPHISLPEDLPGITSGFVFRPQTAKPMRELAEVLLRGPSSLTSAEREMIATFVSTLNDCHFCQSSHRAAPAHHLGGDYGLVNAVRPGYESANMNDKLKTHLTISGHGILACGHSRPSTDLPGPHTRSPAPLVR